MLRSPRETKWTYDNERGGFTITTLHRILGGAQVYDSYGQKCNHRFLLNYGFAIENNQEANGFCPNEVGGARIAVPMPCRCLDYRGVAWRVVCRVEWGAYAGLGGWRLWGDLISPRKKLVCSVCSVVSRGGFSFCVVHTGGRGRKGIDAVIPAVLCGRIDR